MYYELLLYTLTGKLVIFILQKFAFANLSKRGKLLGSRFLNELFECDLCLGVWVFTGLAVAFEINLVDLFYVPIISEILTGAAMSFLVHVFSNGWKALYNVTVIGSD